MQYDYNIGYYTAYDFYIGNDILYNSTDLTANIIFS